MFFLIQTCDTNNKGTWWSPTWPTDSIKSLKKSFCLFLAKLLKLDLKNETKAQPTGGGSPWMLSSPLEYKALSFSISRKGPKRNFQLFISSKGHLSRFILMSSHKAHRRMKRFSCNVALCIKVVTQETLIMVGSAKKVLTLNKNLKRHQQIYTLCKIMQFFAMF